MKHDFKVLMYLILIFFISQFVGLLLLNESMAVINDIDPVTGESQINITYSDIVTGRPELEGGNSFAYVLFSILFGTVLLFILMKLKLHKVWKLWYFVAICLTITIAFGVFLDMRIAFAIGIVFAYLKLYRPNVYIHNITEVFMYSGIAVMLVPMFDLFWMGVLLIAISIYDAYAVWKSKHMVTMAKFQAESKVFAGLLIPYMHGKKKMPTKIHKSIPKGIKTKNVKSAILGGGDVAFPLLFSGAVMQDMINGGMSKSLGLLFTLPVSICAGVALLLLFLKGKKDTFYPAMPFISAGCFVGYLIVESLKYFFV